MRIGVVAHNYFICFGLISFRQNNNHRQKHVQTRMHSSRMHTASSLTVSCSIYHAHPLRCIPPAMHAPPTTHVHPQHIPPPHMPPTTHPPATHTPTVDRILDPRFWKYYLAQTSLRAVNIYLFKILFQKGRCYLHSFVKKNSCWTV